MSVRSFATSAFRNTLSTAARLRAEHLSSQWKGTNVTGGTTRNFIGGEFVESNSSQWHDVLDPVGFLLFLFQFG
jgi:malonate-semialdehyde dehydrogenase (acetylating)/methylmalonate-semialdehyde dehydrogenase